MGSRPMDKDTAMGGTEPSATEMTAGTAVFSQEIPMRPMNQTVTLARSLGITPGIVSTPLARMPPVAVQDMIVEMSQNAVKAQDLAMAAATSETYADNRFLSTAAIKKLDDNLRTVHANTVMAAQDVIDNEGWMRAVRHQHGKQIQRLLIMQDTLISALMPTFNEAQKAKIYHGKEKCKRMEEKWDRGYMLGTTTQGEGEMEEDGEDHE